MAGSRTGGADGWFAQHHGPQQQSLPPHAVPPPTGTAARPPYGRGSLGIEVADRSTSLTPPSEKASFGNEVDFYGKPVLGTQGLNQVGFHVFQTGENISYGGPANMPNITFEINPNLAAAATTYSSLVWLPPASPVTNAWGVRRRR
ncbi:hypothetical protein [Streptomyces erythrochromogenes]|uniref:hypothetical protein n=1 Tax=Streptomyces erythrochromogenes TaxID=285574 RepID=UPI003679DAFD